MTSLATLTRLLGLVVLCTTGLVQASELRQVQVQPANHHPNDASASRTTTTATTTTRRSTVAATVSQKVQVQQQQHHRTLQSSSWFDRVTVCRQNGSDFVTREYIFLWWWFLTSFGNVDGALGPCEEACPCTDNSVCNGVSDTTFACRCVEGFEFDGVICVEVDTAAPSMAPSTMAPTMTPPTSMAPQPPPSNNLSCTKAAGGCDSGYVCTDDVTTDCKINNDPSGCLGVCVQSCGGFTLDPVSCAEGERCVDDPSSGCGQAVDCTGICVADQDAISCTMDTECPDDLPLCLADDRTNCASNGGSLGDCAKTCQRLPVACVNNLGLGCPASYVCTQDPDSGCTLNADPGCLGMCALSCGGFREFPVECPEGTSCLDDPSDNCSPPFIADCPGVCVEERPVVNCGGEFGDACGGDLECIVVPSEECDPFAGQDCVGTCELLPPTCGGFGGSICPNGFVCTDDLDTDCTILNDIGCTGYCARSCGGNSPFATRCEEPDVCVDDPTSGCGQAIDCTGICVTKEDPISCTSALDCPSNLPLCLDDESDNCNPLGDLNCPSVCGRLPVGCLEPSGLGCPSGYVCGNDPDGICDLGSTFGCLGSCGLACGIRGFPVQCPAGTSCQDVPQDGCDPLQSPDCPGICAPDDSPTYCGGLLGNSCPSGLLCTDDPTDGCQLNDALDCGGICVPQCDSENPCSEGLFCNDFPHDNCDPVNNGVDCVGVCQRTKDPLLECGGVAESTCRFGFQCVYEEDCDLSSDFVCSGTCQRVCNGFVGFQCPDLQLCYDDPSDECDPSNGGADCIGFCRKAPFCGGIANIECPLGLECVPDPDDGCDPEEGGADCGGYCQ